MKKLSLIAIIFVLLSFTTQAQDIRFGIKGGVSSDASLLNNLDDLDNVFWGYQAGILVDLNYFGPVSLQPEVLFSSRGDKYASNGFNVEENLKYIDVPVLIKLRPLPILNVYAGPQVSFLVKGEYEYALAGSSTKVDNRDAFNKFDYGFAAGAGLDLGGFMIDLRYMMGFNEIAKDGMINDIVLDNDAKNRSLQLSVGFLF